MKTKLSHRLIAILLALVLPCGGGHFYLGLVRRGLLWAAATSIAIVATASLLCSGSHPVRVGAFAAMLATMVTIWLGPVADLLLLRSSRFARASWWTVVALSVAVFAGETAVRTSTRAYVVEAFKIPSASMWPNLHLQDHIFVDKWGFGSIDFLAQKRLGTGRPPKRGEIFVHVVPEADVSAPRVDFVKRVIAIPGDILELDDGHPIINGWRVPSCRVGSFELRPSGDQLQKGELYLEYLGEHVYPIWLQEGFATGKQGPYIVGPRESWVLGDNRNNSADSRAFNHGLGAGVPDSKLKGRALLVWLAFDAAGRVDLHRFGHDVHGRPQAFDSAPKELASGIERCLAQRPTQTNPPPRQ